MASNTSAYLVPARAYCHASGQDVVPQTRLLELLQDMLHDATELIVSFWNQWDAYRQHFYQTAQAIRAEYSSLLDAHTTAPWLQRIEQLLSLTTSPDDLSDCIYSIARDLLSSVYSPARPSLTPLFPFRHVEFHVNNDVRRFEYVADELLSQCTAALSVYLRQPANPPHINSTPVTTILTILAQTRHGRLKSTSILRLFNYMYDVMSDQLNPALAYKGNLFHMHLSLFDAVRQNKTETSIA
jgi:hypothetical protein